MQVANVVVLEWIPSENVKAQPASILVSIAGFLERIWQRHSLQPSAGPARIIHQKHVSAGNKPSAFLQFLLLPARARFEHRHSLMLGISAFVFKLLGDLARVHLQREFKDTAITRLYHPLFNPSCTMFPFLTFRPRMMSRIQTRSANWSSGAALA
jgi:hypothetical protein